jgi:hypothetical protein
MKKLTLGFAGALVLFVGGAATAQDPTSPDTAGTPTELQGAPLDKPAVGRVPEAATDVAGVPRGSQTTGQAPNVSRTMGAEMDSGGDQRAAPDEQ